MASVFDVAKYILEKCGVMTAIKLQKLVYYSQAWSLVWDEKPLFDETIEAWKMGPVIPVLFKRHQGCYQVDIDMFPDGSTQNLSDPQKETIDEVINTYGSKPAQWLVDLSHTETPWRKARAGVPDGYGYSGPINISDIADYYSSL